jgi:hypothetical protein
VLDLALYADHSFISKTVSRLQHKSSADILTSPDAVFLELAVPKRGKILLIWNDHLFCVQRSRLHRNNISLGFYVKTFY